MVSPHYRPVCFITTDQTTRSFGRLYGNPVKGIGSLMEYQGLSYVVLNTLHICVYFLQITLLELSSFDTGLQFRAPNFPAPPAYNKPHLASHRLRQWFSDPANTKFMGDPYLATERIVDCASLPYPPLRLVLGKQAIEGVREKLQVLSAEVNEFENWSDDLVGGV